MNFKELMNEILNVNYETELIDGFEVIKENTTTGDVASVNVPLGNQHREPDMTGPFKSPAFSVDDKTFTKVLKRDTRNKGEWWKKFIGDSGIGSWRKTNKQDFYLSYNNVFLKVK